MIKCIMVSKNDLLSYYPCRVPLFDQDVKIALFNIKISFYFDSIGLFFFLPPLLRRFDINFFRKLV